MICKTRLKERHHHRNLLRIVVPALPVEPDERSASADRLLHIHVRIHKISQMPNENAIRFHSRVLQDVQLFERRLARNASVREDRQVRRNVRPADRPDDLPSVISTS